MEDSDITFIAVQALVNVPVKTMTNERRLEAIAELLINEGYVNKVMTKK